MQGSKRPHPALTRHPLPTGEEEHRAATSSPLPCGEAIGQQKLFDAERGIYFAPIRHHSPACAWHLRALIAEVQPRQVLIEGPIDFEPLIDVLLDAATRPPVAIVAFPGEKDERWHLSYYPFSAHAPEYIALTEGRRLGARLAFIDLPAGHRLSLRQDDDAVAHSFADERPFSVSDYTRALCQRTGCRDQNELWDHLFETRIGAGTWRDFFAATAEYCASVRATFGAAEMTADGTLAREEHMRERIAAALASEGPIVVVTGGFHTPALIEDLGTQAQPKSSAKREKIMPARSYLIRYGFQELDRLNGYASGLPLPLYYERLWHHAGQDAHDEPGGFWHSAAAELLTQFATHLRRERPGFTPPLPAIANALEHAVRLARLRDRPGPTRQDILDAALACFVKGEAMAGATPILDELATFLTGDALGDVPPSAGSPPLVETVREAAKRLGFDLSFASRKNRELDIYRSERQRQASRFLHAMVFVEAGLGTRIKGPDFFAGYSEELLFETWAVAWSPMVEAKLIELSRFGETLEDVALARLRQHIRDVREKAEGSGALAAIKLLLTACQIGLQDRIGEILPVIEEEIAADADLATVTRALSQLFLLWRARNVLGMVGSEEVERLIGVAYRRALYLLGDLKDTKAERLKDTLDGLAALREVVSSSASGGTGQIDPSLFDEAIERRLDDRLAPVLAGAMAALAFLAGLRDSAFLVDRVCGHLGGAYADVAENVAALNGIVAISPELLWRVPELLAEIDGLMGGFDEARFIEQLPHLRLAFSAFNPNETDEIAKQVAALHGADAGVLQAPVAYGVSEAELAANLGLSEKIRASLAADGLEDWLSESVGFLSPCPNPPHLAPDGAALSQVFGLHGRASPAMAGRGLKKEGATSQALGEARTAARPNPLTLRRWRLVLGRYSEASLGEPQLTELDMRADRALDHLYGREMHRRGLRGEGGKRHGSLDPTKLSALKWLGEVRDLFPASVCETIQGHALDRYGMTDLLREPSVVQSLTPSTDLLKAVMCLKGRADPAVRTAIRDVARRVIDDIMKRLKPRVESALSGTRNRFASSPLKNIRNFDWRRTIRENLKNYDAERRVLVADRLRFHARSRRKFPWTIVLCVDQSGSMVSSVIFSAVMAAIISGLPSVKLHLVAFDTSIVDLTDQCSDPVEVLMSVQLGGGTDIGRAVSYCETLVTQPARTVFVLVSDFCEGAPPAFLVSAVRRLAEARVTLLGLAALDEQAVPDYDRAMAGRLADVGMKIAALTPEHFANWLAGVMN